MNTTYDVIVIGAGVAGGSIATKAQQEGKEVAVIEQSMFGGTCPNKGCIPKKVMTGLVQTYAESRQLTGVGIKGELSLNWHDLLAYKDEFTEPVPDATEESLRAKGIVTYKGKASFLDPHTVKVGEENLTATHIVIATGAKPTPLPIDGADHMITSDEFLDLKELPERIVFIGGGYISFEFAHICARLNKDVVMIHRGRHVLENFDHEMTNKLVELSKDIGIDIHTGTEATSITKLDNGSYKIDVTKFDHEHTLKADMIVHGAGRQANITGLELNNAGIEASEKGIIVNHNMQSTSQPHIYAAGDVADTLDAPLTPNANKNAEQVIRHMFEEKGLETTRPTPSIVYTHPKLAAVGLTQQEAQEKKIPYEEQSKNIEDYFTYSRKKDIGAYAKILTNPHTDEILGAHVLTSEADHLINIFTLAIQKNLTKHDLEHVLWGFPTAESDIPSLF
ncbi:NAD(P)/FAD-dependent oxidoreductase [Thalassobacillus sp. CUG 92003]|uniref:dihydrolipoyl dehydrogenase family protein n=1 Tax=Thalassobacillus sp. CUG 92003 TaxID=2736641 RepID=UPI0015E73757|nr:NAD(P)/FAD-dependent oxidoreductase [Thalassobacillus sp. CUG 92003]